VYPFFITLTERKGINMYIKLLFEIIAMISFVVFILLSMALMGYVVEKVKEYKLNKKRCR
jgi:hypothetical protein